jgi:type IV secretion system protein VirD4
LWDEAANTGQVPHLEKMIAVIRSREVSLCMFLQAQSQLKALYEKHCETILGNCDSVIFLGGREHSTVKELSEVLGKSSINMYTSSRTRGQQESYGQNLQGLGRELMTLDELTTMPGDKCILQLRGLRPFFSPKYDIRGHPNFKHTAEADKKNAFDAASLVNRRMKPKPNDMYTVYEVDGTDEGMTEADVNEDIDMDILNYDDLDDPDAFI